ncbi:MAG TPA: iron-sulfur cluster assembly scaffold protein [Patescibacteria group bacterium]|nr:iron-sulfur cluster assembly scaffold protein [Patescibacteria group bacterium]
MSIYRDEILEHYNNPQNFGQPKKFDIVAKQVNPFCGDEIEIYIELESSQVHKVKKIYFFGKGCAISIASASLLTEFVKGKTLKELTDLTQEDMLSLLGVEVSPTRRKCALLAMATLKEGLK